MSSFEKDLEEITDSETLTPIDELKISAPIYFRNNISDRKEFLSLLAKKMKIKDITAYVYFMSMLTGKLYENMPPTYFKMMKKAIDILNAPEYLKDLLKQAKKQPKEKRQKMMPTIEEKIEKINETREEISHEECPPDQGYETISSEIKTLPNNTTVRETKYANGAKMQTPHPIPLEEQIICRTYIPKLGWVYGPFF